MGDYKVMDVVAGEHMTVCLAMDGSVWTCGRNACGALGRKTKSEGMKVYGSQRVKTEVKPDFMRKVQDLSHISVDWIGAGSVVWFAHNRKHGAVYAFGDSSSGRAGIGCWKSSRGRPVFDEYNLDTNKYEVSSANGGSDHVIFTVRRKKRLARRHSSVSDTHSREVSTTLDEAVVNGMSNLCQIEEHKENENDHDNEDVNKNVKHSHNNNKNGIVRMVAPLTQQIPRRRARKRKRNQIEIASIVEEQPVIVPRLQQSNAVVPGLKRRKVDESKPNLANAKTTPVHIRSSNNDNK